MMMMMMMMMVVEVMVVMLTPCCRCVLISNTSCSYKGFEGGTEGAGLCVGGSLMPRASRDHKPWVAGRSEGLSHYSGSCSLSVWDHHYEMYQSPMTGSLRRDRQSTAVVSPACCQVTLAASSLITSRSCGSGNVTSPVCAALRSTLLGHLQQVTVTSTSGSSVTPVN
jgi:hypothetical protein